MLDDGPGLASSGSMLELRSRLGKREQPRWVRALPVGVLAVCLLAEAGLWLGGFPVWRIAAVGVLLVVMVTGMHRGTRFEVVRIDARPAALFVSTLVHVGVVALTGGLHSPLLVILVGFSGSLLSYGWSRTTRIALAMEILAVIAMALLPRAWFGPPVSEPAFSMLVGLVVIAVAALNTGVYVTLTGELGAVHGEIDRAHEEMASAALARARELEQLSARLSHELKNPLGAIKTLVQLSAREAGDDRSREGLRVAEAEIERMSEILKEYLSFSRPLEKLRREPLALGALADETISILAAQAMAKGVALHRRGDARLEADARRLKEALFNLVANALEATPRGGSVQIRIDEREGAISLSVTDSGRGMPKEVLERLGTPFFTTREQGTGLGVALARSVFVQHGGTLEYASVEGRGTTALARLPARARERRSDGAAAAG